MRRLTLLWVPAVIVALAQLTGCGVSCQISPSISGQPSSQTIVTGQPALLTVAASGSGPLSYQWFKNGSAIQGATQASYLTPTTSAADNNSSFTVTVQNQFGTLTSDPAYITVSSSAISAVAFVDPNGNDSNSGTINQPYQTIQHCATAVAQGWTCAVRAGTYRETVTPKSGITIEAYNFEPVVVDGSDPVTGWMPYSGSIYRAPVTLGTDDMNQVFVGNQMMTEARWPNGDDLFHVNWATAQSGTDSGTVFDDRLPSLDWTGAKIHLWSGEDPFGHETGVVTGSGYGRITVNVETGTCPVICPESGGYYYLFGTLAALDAEREWYYDSGAGFLYFMAPGKVNPNKLNVRAKKRQFAFDLRGKSGVTIRNIGIFSASIMTDSNSTNNTLDRIDAQYVSHFTSLASGPSLAYLNWGGDWGILVVHAADTGIVIDGTGNVIQNSTISYSAGSGIALEGSNNTVKNNLIENIDYIGDYASGIVLDGNGNNISQNTIHTIGRQAIVVDAVLNEDIGYNNLYNAMMLSRDGAEIYTCCAQLASGTRIHHNWLHDTTIAVSGTGDTYPLSGVTFDNGSNGFNVDQNVLWNNERDNINVFGVLYSGPTTTYIHNNTIPDDSRHGFIRIEDVPDCTLTRIVDNQVAIDVYSAGNGTACNLSNNNSSAPGANEMSASTQVGCNFDGCSSNPPPGFGLGNLVTLCPVTAVQQANNAMVETGLSTSTMRSSGQPALNCSR
jgi:hypothetical protein